MEDSAPETPVLCRDSDQDLPHLGSLRELSLSPWGRVPLALGQFLIDLEDYYLSGWESRMAVCARLPQEWDSH